MAACAACGAENRERARFCDGCGAPLDSSADRHDQRKTVTVVFCDLVGSTALGESRDPEAVQLLLNRYFERMRAIVERHGGTVEKFIGDAVVAVFGVPVLHEDDALRAVRAAAEMRDAVPALGLQARFGVNTGEVVESRETLISGDPVNVAARLEQAAAPGEVLIGAETLALVRDAVSVEELIPLELKGKQKPVAAYRLLGVGERPERRHDARFVGRGEELAALQATWARAVEGARCELVTVVGEAGVGKSRLVAELVASLEARVVRGRCLSYGEGITYFPVVEVVKQLGAVHPDPHVASAIGSLLGENGAPTSPDEIAWAFRKLLEASAPLAVVFDDIHWGEETFLDLIEHVAQLSTGAPLLLLCVARPELNERRPRWPVALRLEPLPPAEVDKLLPDAFPAGLRERIARAAGGNPLFVTEMVAMAAGAGEDVAVPPTLKALLAARLDQLERAERGVLERGAVEGELFHRGAVVALASADAQVTSKLTALVRKELIRPDRPMLAAEDGFRFCHLLIRDTAYDALPKATRAELHERFADWLDRHGAELVERDEIVGYHLQQAYRYQIELGSSGAEARELAERAAVRLVAGGRRATTRGDHHAAANLFHRALELGIADERERVHVQLELGNALIETGQISVAAGGIAEAHEAAVRVGDRGASALALVYRVTVRGADPENDLRETQAACEQAIEVFAELGDELGLAQARRQLGISLSRQGQRTDGLLEYERALGHADASGDQAVRRRVIGTLIHSYYTGATPAAQAIARCEELLATSASDRVLEAVIKRFLGFFYAMAGRSDEALELVRESSEVLDELNQLTVSGLYRGAAAYARELAGDRAGAERELLARWSYFTDSGFDGVDRRAIDTAYELAQFYCDEGRWDEAERFVDPLRDIPLTSRHVIGAAMSRLALEARLAARDGRYAEAVALAEQAIAGAETEDRPDATARFWLVLADAQRGAGRPAEADAAIAAALALYEQRGNLAAAARVRAATESG